MEALSDTIAFLKEDISHSSDLHWYLSGTFRYMQGTDVEEFCRKGSDSGFEQQTSCFRAVYLQYVLEKLGIPKDARSVDMDWTLGAVICADTQCLETQ